jgi:hypothetical protein
MSILSDFEDRVSRAVEGLFAGVFRSPVQPAEVARACAKEMDRRRKLGVGKIYAPTLYSVLLSPEDADQLGGFAETFAGELETYLVGYAREREYELATRPRVHFLVDDGLKLGRFDVIGELMSAKEIAAAVGEYQAPGELESAPAASAPAAPVGATAVVRPETGSAGEGPRTTGATTLTIRATGREFVLAGERMVIGRLKTCDICLQDANASREHAAVEREGSGWAVEDLGSTNGTLLNGERASRARLRNGDVIAIGASELEFSEPEA